MDVTFSENLRSYMADHGFVAVLVDTARARSCGGAIPHLDLRCIGADELERRRGDAVRVLEGTGASAGLCALVAARGLEYDEHIEFGLRSFIGILKDVTVRGITAMRVI